MDPFRLVWLIGLHGLEQNQCGMHCKFTTNLFFATFTSACVKDFTNNWVPTVSDVIFVKFKLNNRVIHENNFYLHAFFKIHNCLVLIHCPSKVWRQNLFFQFLTRVPIMGRS